MALWDRITSRGQVEDRRSAPMAVGGIGLTGVALLLIFNLLSGGNLSDVLSQLPPIAIQNPQTVEDRGAYDGEDSYELFSSRVLGSNNDLWAATFSENGQNYTTPKLVLFRNLTPSSCGNASSEVGPHYCPLDETIYLDETFFDELTNRFGAKGGDVAEAYVIAHEAGHHAQNQLGIMSSVNKLASQNPDLANQLSVNLELQADCFAGLWANSLKDQAVFEPNEINEALDAAAAVGDDRIQQKVNGYINPESWTHGSSQERVNWFNKGYESGSLKACDTFNNS